MTIPVSDGCHLSHLEWHPSDNPASRAQVDERQMLATRLHKAPSRRRGLTQTPVAADSSVSILPLTLQSLWLSVFSCFSLQLILQVFSEL